eukprot:TRINITY_DN15480_c0_g1_i2.p1 TRINITY_DN15480_c0_g1~~TRINITY_DN15480_c0_g1_i2.p1  ORF type:complete len:586 (-),score=133.18 TRINITY_DN15480_c0_g1_i2:68-1825(-)
MTLPVADLALGATLLPSAVASAHRGASQAEVLAEAAGGPLRAIEAALQAWAESEPTGFVLPESRALGLLFALGAALPGDGKSFAERARLLEALVRPLLPSGCSTVSASATKEQGGLPPRIPVVTVNGRMHFLHFWRAFGALSRLSDRDRCSAAPADGVSGGAGRTTASLVCELEDLRDVLLDLVDGSAASAAKPAAISEAIEGFGRCSAFPDFWKALSQSWEQQAAQTAAFALDDVAVLLLSWLYDAALWQHSPAETLQATMQFSGNGSWTLGSPAGTASFTVAGVTPREAPPNMRTAMLFADEYELAMTSLRLPASEPPSPNPLGLRSPPPAVPEEWTDVGADGVAIDSSPARTAPMTPSRHDASDALASASTSLLVGAGECSFADAPAGVEAAQNLRTALLPLDSPTGSANCSMREGLPVFLHVYDVSHEAVIHRLNAVLAHRRSPLKFGGIFHTGVEVAGTEWYFGYCEEGSGVRSQTPRNADLHRFRQTVDLPRTWLDETAVKELVGQLREEYNGRGYDLLRRNCCHFADDLCQRLGVGRIPGWVYRLARIGARWDAVLRIPVSQSRQPSPEHEARPLLGT